MAEQRGKGSRGGGIGSLVGAGPSVVGVSGAMRARDVSRPRPEQVADADANLVIRRRALDAPLPPLPTAGPKRPAG